MADPMALAPAPSRRRRGVNDMASARVVAMVTTQVKGEKMSPRGGSTSDARVASQVTPKAMASMARRSGSLVGRCTVAWKSSIFVRRASMRDRSAPMRASISSSRSENQARSPSFATATSTTTSADGAVGGADALADGHEVGAAAGHARQGREAFHA